MKTIKKGLHPDKRIYRGTCIYCGEVLEAERGELKITDSQREGESASHKCPTCGQSVSFKRYQPKPIFNSEQFDR